MGNRPTIQKFTAAFLALLLLIGTAPKNWFHDALANHKDAVVVCHHPGKQSPCLHQRPVNCHFDLLVVTSFYEFRAEVFALAPLSHDAVFISKASPECYPFPPASPEGRGPPPGCS